MTRIFVTKLSHKWIRYSELNSGYMQKAKDYHEHDQIIGIVFHPANVDFGINASKKLRLLITSDPPRNFLLLK